MIYFIQGQRPELRKRPENLHHGPEVLKMINPWISDSAEELKISKSSPQSSVHTSQAFLHRENGSWAEPLPSHAVGRATLREAEIPFCSTSLPTTPSSHIAPGWLLKSATMTCDMDSQLFITAHCETHAKQDCACLCIRDWNLLAKN